MCLRVLVLVIVIRLGLFQIERVSLPGDGMDICVGMFSLWNKMPRLVWRGCGFRCLFSSACVSSRFFLIRKNLVHLEFSLSTLLVFSLPCLICWWSCISCFASAFSLFYMLPIPAHITQVCPSMEMAFTRSFLCWDSTPVHPMRCASLPVGFASCLFYSLLFYQSCAAVQFFHQCTLAPSYICLKILLPSSMSLYLVMWNSAETHSMWVTSLGGLFSTNNSLAPCENQNKQMESGWMSKGSLQFDCDWILGRWQLFPKDTGWIRKLIVCTW